MKQIQIYGLPRTGTNYLEFLILNNLDCYYNNKRFYTDMEFLNNIVKSYFSYSSYQIALKHCSPNINHADYFIIILKKSGNFIKSFKKWGNNMLSKNMSDEEIINMFKNALKDYLKFYEENSENTIIVFHENLIGNEDAFLRKVSEKFDIPLKSQEIIITNKRMGRIGGITFDVGNNDYIFNDTPEIEINNDYNEIKNKNILRNNVKNTNHILWFTGLSGSGKTTLGKELVKYFKKKGKNVFLLDGDVLRTGLNYDLGFSEEDRLENIRRAAEVAKILNENNIIVIATFITPTNKIRNQVKDIIKNVKFIYLNCSLSVCENRDVKGLYKKVRNGEIKIFSGIDSPFEYMEDSWLNLNTGVISVEESIRKIINKLNI